VLTRARKAEADPVSKLRGGDFSIICWSTAHYHQTICAVQSHTAHLQHSKTLKKHKAREAVWIKHVF